MTVVLSGSNSFQLGQELSKFEADFRKSYGDLAIEKLDGQEDEISRIKDSLQSMPFLVSKKMVVLHKPSSSKDFVEQIDEILKSIPDETELVIVEPKLDKRLSYYKTLRTKTDFRDFSELDALGLSTWLVQAAKDRGAVLAQSDAAYLVGRIGLNQALLAHELEKLALYNTKISRENINLLTELTPQGTTFELLEAAFAGDEQAALHIYRQQRQQKVEPQVIIGLLAWQLHVLALIKTSAERSAEEISRQAKLNPYVVRKSIPIARRLELTKLKRYIATAVKLDVQLKRSAMDADEALEQFFLRVALETR